MDQRLPRVAEQLLLIERELRVLGLWSSRTPDARALASLEPFCMDTLRFEEWLQWVFLPRMKVILERDEPLPGASGIGAMAEMVFAERLGSVKGLLTALEVFDQVISEG
ncbi:YqcC family protein [Stutzerimonas tarimensis]|uniref:YqcC family protein n=1 Tax=Stutzerimonas tarimensis TaxID=1507735 RepID=A0ABV7T1U0_9GAMM